MTDACPRMAVVRRFPRWKQQAEDTLPGQGRGKKLRCSSGATCSYVFLITSSNTITGRFAYDFTGDLAIHLLSISYAQRYYMGSLVHWKYKHEEGTIPALQKLLISTPLSAGPSSYHWEFRVSISTSSYLATGRKQKTVEKAMISSGRLSLSKSNLPFHGPNQMPPPLMKSFLISPR